MPHRKPHRAAQGGFTLIEVVITLAIIGLLATVAAPLASVTIKRAKETELKVALREIRTAIDAYKEAAESGRVEVAADATGYPADLRLLYEGVEDKSSPDKKLIYFMRRLPRDPFYPDATVPPDESWGLRSYASPPDAPAPGDDVYDVHSLDTGKALNGVPYSEW